MCSRRFVQALGIHRSTKTKGDTRAEKLVVSKSRNPLVVDLGFDESSRVELVLAGNLQTHTASVSALSIPGGFCTSLNLGIHFVVV